MAQIQLTVALVMIALFSVAIIGFAINFAADNNAPIDISDDSSISGLYTNNKASLTNFSTDSNSTYKSILEATIAPGSGSAQSTGPFAVTWTNVFGVSKNIMEVGYSKIFGTNNGFNIFLVALEGIIAFMAGLFIYKTLRGSPD